MSCGCLSVSTPATGTRFPLLRPCARINPVCRSNRLVPRWTPSTPLAQQYPGEPREKAPPSLPSTSSECVVSGRPHRPGSVVGFVSSSLRHVANLMLARGARATREFAIPPRARSRPPSGHRAAVADERPVAGPVWRRRRTLRRLVRHALLDSLLPDSIRIPFRSLDRIPWTAECSLHSAGLPASPHLVRLVFRLRRLSARMSTSP